MTGSEEEDARDWARATGVVGLVIGLLLGVILGAVVLCSCGGAQGFGDYWEGERQRLERQGVGGNNVQRERNRILEQQNTISRGRWMSEEPC